MTHLKLPGYRTKWSESGLAVEWKRGLNKIKVAVWNLKHLNNYNN